MTRIQRAGTGKAGLELSHLASESRFHAWQGLACEVLCVPKSAHGNTELKYVGGQKRTPQRLVYSKNPPRTKCQESKCQAHGRQEAGGFL